MCITSRGVFDKQTRRKPLAFAADAAAMEIEGRFGTRRPGVGVAHWNRDGAPWVFDGVVGPAWFGEQLSCGE